MPQITIFGLGEAGSRFAQDLTRRGVRVNAFDPAEVAEIAGVDRSDDPASAVEDADAVLALTPGDDALTALRQAIEAVPAGALYADLSTSSPDMKIRLATEARARRLDFADVALMAPVPLHGLATPSLAAGTGAQRYADLITAVGGSVEVLGEQAGDAATRKLLRSIVMKGLASLAIEARSTARVAGQEEWLWSHLSHMLREADGALLERLVDGTPTHADRRAHEMEAAEQLVRSTGVDPVMTRATLQSLRSLARHQREGNEAD